MALIGQKCGGTSVGSPERIHAVAKKVALMRKNGEDLFVVFSAMSGETDRLLKLAKTINADPPPRELDVLLATGEQATIALLAMALEKMGCPARSYTGHQVHIRTDNVYGKARILDIDESRVRDDLNKGRVVVVAGFQGVDEEGNITTLGRGGSDTTAVAMAAALKADECQIYTDVDGVYTTDPRIVPEAKLAIRGVPDRPGIASHILEAIAKANINVDMIVQNVGADGTTDFTFTAHRGDYAQAMKILKAVAGDLGAREAAG